MSNIIVVEVILALGHYNGDGCTKALLRHFYDWII